MFDKLKYNFISGVFRKAPFIIGRKLTDPEVYSSRLRPSNSLIVELNNDNPMYDEVRVVGPTHRPPYNKSLYVLDSVSSSNIVNLLKIKKFLLDNFSEFIFKECSTIRSFARVLVNPTVLQKNYVYYTQDLQPLYFLKKYKSGKCKVRTTDFKISYIHRTQIFIATSVRF